jgi:hypothetical protein
MLIVFFNNNNFYLYLLVQNTNLCFNLRTIALIYLLFLFVIIKRKVSKQDFKKMRGLIKFN